MHRRDLRLFSLVAAALLAGLGALQPKLALPQRVFNYVFVLDITQSMNARDYQLDGLPADRLAFAKAALQHSLERLPCGSKVGVALFTSKNIFLLFDPLEVCAHYPAIAQSLNHVDWRMAWDADSHIARGVFTAIRDLLATQADSRLVFLTDGQQIPAAAAAPAFLYKPGAIQGLLVGVGNLQAVPVPKYDRNGEPVGQWQNADFDNGGKGLFLSALQETALQRLAGVTGLQYHHLETTEGFAAALHDEQYAQTQDVPQDIGGILALLALAALLWPYVPILTLKVRRWAIG